MLKTIVFAMICALVVFTVVYTVRTTHADEASPVPIPDAQKYHIQAIDVKVGMLQMQYNTLKQERDGVEAEIWKVTKLNPAEWTPDYMAGTLVRKPKPEVKK